MAGPEYRERLKADTIAIARRILATEGLPALQARRIAKEAGCSVGTIYNLYANLDDLIIVANAGTLEDLGEALAAELAATSDQPFAQRLVAIGLTYLRFAVEEEKAWRAIFEHHVPKDETVPSWYRERQAQLFSIVEQLLANAMADPAERTKTARALFAAVHGIVSLALDQKLGTFDHDGTEDQIRFVVGAAAAAIQEAGPQTTA